MSAPSPSMFYRSEGRTWLDALPLGNGRIGMMVYGGAHSERLQLDEATFWSGAASTANVRGGPDDIKAIRERLLAGDYRASEKLCRRITGDKRNYGSHLPLGDLLVELDSAGDVDDYVRRLDLDTGIASVEYTFAGQRLAREMFVSNPQQVAVVRLTVDGAAAPLLRLSFSGAGATADSFVDERGDLVIEALAREAIHSDGHTGVALGGRVRLLAPGATLSGEGRALAVEGWSTITILVALATTFNGGDPAAACLGAVDGAAGIAYDDLKSAHVADFGGLMRRFALRLGDDASDELPTDERLERVRGGAVDPGLDALMCQYGRYLVAASSRPDSPLPNHLQGIWNDNLACRMEWTCDMHLDINTQMNYWPAEAGNLGECSAPLWRWMANALVPSGQRTARELYGCGGWTAHTVANAWGYSAPGWHESWGIWPAGGAWLATHLWERYRYGGDSAFLEHTAYPLLRGCAEFIVDYLALDPASGYLVGGPSMSPENGFVAPGGVRAHNSAAPTCDVVLFREVLSNTIDAARELGRDGDQAAQLAAVRDRLPPFHIGAQGQLQEWLVDWEAADPHHRHISHLLALYPLSQVTPQSTPRLANAAARAIELRLTPPGAYEMANWAIGLLMAYQARLGDGSAAYEQLRAAYAQLTYANLMVCHPVRPGDEVGIYELDGNTGISAAIMELLLHSHDGIRLLPALPPEWASGEVRGICARGGFEVDMRWEGGALLEATIRSKLGGSCTVHYGGRTRTFDLAAGTSITI